MAIRNRPYEVICTSTKDHLLFYFLKLYDFCIKFYENFLAFAIADIYIILIRVPQNDYPVALCVGWCKITTSRRSLLWQWPQKVVPLNFFARTTKLKNWQIRKVLCNNRHAYSNHHGNSIALCKKSMNFKSGKCRNFDLLIWLETGAKIKPMFD